MITGGTGSLGQALTRRLLDGNLAERIVVYSRSEYAQAQMAERLGHDPRVSWINGDVRDRERLDDALHRVDTVVHAAALKMIDGTEPLELYKTNIDGTVNVVKAALRRRIAHVLMISSDKEAAACTAYGISKAAASQYVLYANVWGHPQTRLACVRYGNVLGSRGSLLPCWRRQMAQSLPLTITDPQATRFWLRMVDAVDFILWSLQAMTGGEVFVPACRASSLARLAEALTWEGDPPTKPLRLRAGEKRHEVLLVPEEAERAVRLTNGTFVVHSPYAAWHGRQHRGEELAPGFTWRSDTAPQIPVTELADWIREVPEGD